MPKLRLLTMLAPSLIRRSGRWPIRTVAWSGLALMGLMATAGAWLASWVVDFASQWVGDGSLREAADTATRLPAPDWLSTWIDPAWVRALQAFSQQLLHLGGDALPMLGQGIGLLNWVIWGLWALLMLALGFAALKVHLLVEESQRGVTRHSAPSATSVNR